MYFGERNTALSGGTVECNSLLLERTEDHRKSYVVIAFISARAAH